ncbi:hypothetical protein J6TS7_42560 [Paenibacillus dendritiformis]|nr:hypothetical protein J6TS7_42560 [Paenibacillus dendritiformis]
MILYHRITSEGRREEVGNDFTSPSIFPLSSFASYDQYSHRSGKGDKPPPLPLMIAIPIVQEGMSFTFIPSNQDNQQPY